MKKRILSIVLAVLTLVGIMPISAIAADAEPPESNITAVKSAQWVEGREGEGMITITNTFEETAPEPEPEDEYRIGFKFYKTVKGSGAPTETFEFDIDFGDELNKSDNFKITVEKNAEDHSNLKFVTISLNKEEFEKLPKRVFKFDDFDDEEIGLPYLTVTEREGDTEGMRYNTDPVYVYLHPIPDHNSAEEATVYVYLPPIPDHNSAEEATVIKVDGRTFDEESGKFDFARVTNTYKKPGEKGETIKSGPQLNRDDHVAYIMGYPDGTVQPEGQITRAEACTIFFRLLTDSSRDYYFARTNDYSDVNRGDWFNNAISTLSNAGIVTGYNDGTFRPNQPITRGEMAKIIANFANLKYGGKTFTDLAGHWSKSYVELAAGNGWIAGYPDGSFHPDQKITRAETVTMINRVLDRVPAKESRLLSRSIMLTFPDNKPGDWYYIAIQEASNSHEYRRSVYETTGDEMWTKLIDNVDWTKLEK